MIDRYRTLNAGEIKPSATMGVPDAAMSAGPVKKRARLSLQKRKKSGGSPAAENANSNTTSSPKESEVAKSGSFPNITEIKPETKCEAEKKSVENENSNDIQAEDRVDSCSKSETKVPPVSSLENLGNTCFMNSVMQVLRYTPGFLDNLAYLFEDIQASEKIKRKNKKTDEDKADSEDENTQKSWKIVKNLYKVYRDLSRLEDEYDEVASDDVMSMAVRPTRLMTSIRDINCMFEGNMQHDAQEFLRCLLCYIQDAEKEGRKFYSQLPQKFSPKAVTNPVMQKFIQSAKDVLAKDIDTTEILSRLEDTCCKDKSDVDNVKVNLFDKPSSGCKPLESIGESPECPKEGDTATVINTIHIPDPMADTAAENKSTEKARKNTKVKKTSKSKPHSKKTKGAQRKRKNTENDNDVDKPEEKIDESPESPKNSSSTASKKRLGMRGAVIVKSEDNILCKEQLQSNEKLYQDGKSKYLEVSMCKLDVKQEENKQVIESKSDSVLGNRKFQEIFCRFVSNMSQSEDSDSLDFISDSEDEDIVVKKKREKELHDTPRRSPRKVASTNSSSTPGKLHGPSPLSLSKSDTCVNRAKSNLCFLLDSTTNKVQTNSPSSQTNYSTPTKMCSTTMDKTVSDDMDQVALSSDSDLTERVSSSPSISLQSQDVAMEPVVKLENCDFIFEKNMKSVSAVFACKYLSPTKRTPRKFSSNYLKQKNLMSGFEGYSNDMVKSALMDMLNSPVKSRSKYDLIERLFQGTMMLKTKCLSCESARERTEDFHDISVPVRIEAVDSDDEDGEEKVNSDSHGLLDLIEASTEVEKLQEDNKYFCDECKRYVEAERSIHYDLLPDVLTLHLKRFSAESGNLGFISKINDHVNIPMTLPCLKYKCPKTCLRPDHKYKLYSIITHSGVTLSSGHYLAYVRALPKHPDPPETPPPVIVESPVKMRDETTCAEETKVSGSSDKSKMKKSDKLHVTRRKAGKAPKLPSRFDNSVVASTKVKTFSKLVQKKPSVTETLRTSVRFTSEWFECDDETVRVFDEAAFIDLLSGKEGSLLGTPYLLFYHKATMA